MIAKWLSLEEAASKIEDGMTLALGGMTLYRRPSAFVHAMLARKSMPQLLTLLCFTAGYESDLLIGAGCVDIVRSCYIGLEAFSFAPMFTQAANQGMIKIIEESEASLVLGIQATLSNVPTLLSRAWIGTDMFSVREDVRWVNDPYSNDLLVAFPAIKCDVVVIHALAADKDGNVQLNNNLGIDKELALLAEKVIVTVETCVDSLSQADGFILPELLIDHLVLIPKGAWPTSCYPYYPLDGREILRYIELSSQGQFATYLESIQKL